MFGGVPKFYFNGIFGTPFDGNRPAPHCTVTEPQRRSIFVMTRGAEQNNDSQASSPPRLRMLDDAELGAALLSGCTDALAILFERYSRLVFHIARNIVKDNGEAEETVQQVFFDLFRAIRQFRPERGSFKTWLLQFAYHRSINRRQHLLANRFYNSEEHDETMFGGLLDRAQCALRLSPLETTHFIEQMLATLKPKQR